MVACRCLMLSLLLLLLIGLVSAFGPRLEPGGHIVTTDLRMSLRTGSDQDSDNESQVSPSHRFALHYESRFEEINGEIFQSRLFISEPFVFDSSSFGIVNPFDDFALVEANAFSNSYDEYDDDDVLSCRGDDCVDCSIPEEYRQIENPIDVLAYLGLRRAKPLQAPTFDKSIGDWE
jgi:hypothetical protein